MASTAVDPMTQGAMASQYINPKNDAEQCFQDGSSMICTSYFQVSLQLFWGC